MGACLEPRSLTFHNRLCWVGRVWGVLMGMLTVWAGMHAIKDKVVAVDGKVEIRPIMVVALTYDHRLLDGREAVTFLGE